MLLEPHCQTASFMGKALGMIWKINDMESLNDIVIALIIIGNDIIADYLANWLGRSWLVSQIGAWH